MFTHHENPHPRRRPRHNARPRPQRRPPTKMLHNLPHRPNHVIRPRLLPLLPIDLCPIPYLIRIPANRLLTRYTRSNRRKPIEALRIPKLAPTRAGRELEVPR